MGPLEERPLGMIGLRLERAPDSVVCLGAHPDDIEVGALGFLANLARTAPDTSFIFAIATGDDERIEEATESARALLGDRVSLLFGNLTDGMLPYDHAAEVKSFIRGAADPGTADIVLAPRRIDRHQDHRLVAEMAHQVFRKSLILEYEIVKLEGDLGQPSLYHPLSKSEAAAKADHLAKHFPGQHDKIWYDRETFMGLMRIRGIECLAPDGYAEAFHAGRISLS